MWKSKGAKKPKIISLKGKGRICFFKYRSNFNSNKLIVESRGPRKNIYENVGGGWTHQRAKDLVMVL